MKVLQINIFGNLSTGRICVDLYKVLQQNGYEGKFAFSRNEIDEDVPYIKIGNKFDVYIDGILTRLTDKAGFYSKKSTRKLINDIQRYEPDIIHLHNLHGYYINIEILFNFLKKYGRPIVWTLHDCWAFTGHCCHYSSVNCQRWITECHDCPQLHEYPKSLFIDNSKGNYIRKKEIFTSVPNLYIVTVSDWLKNEVNKSFFKNIPSTTIYNGINLNMFKPTKSNLRNMYHLNDKFIILGVASTWTNRKGFDDFIKLSKILTGKYVIVLVGIDTKQEKQLRSNMIGIKRTNSVYELAGIYSTADVYFNASKQESFGLTTVESLACGTPVIVYNATAIPEVVNDEVGFVVDTENLQAVKDKILYLDKHKISAEKCIGRAEYYEKNIQFKKYIKLYESIVLKSVQRN